MPAGSGDTFAAVKRVLILGSTGSIGVQALDVIDDAADMTCVGLACGTRVDDMRAQADARGIPLTCAAVGGGSIAHSQDLGDLIDAAEPDIVVNALVGAAGLPPTLAALERGIAVALANKESLVAGGDLVAAARARTGAGLVPVDSEHSALFQLLEGVTRSRVHSVILTASGGPFRGRSRSDLEDVTPSDALAHPTWDMGAKISIDSATLMNKGLEVIEAHHLFGLPFAQVEVVVHPQSMIHAMVRLDDGSILAHMGPPDMRVPIGHALRWPAPPPPREQMGLAGMSWQFEEPDVDVFPCLRLAIDAGKAGGTAPAILNAANEEAVRAFLLGEMGFMDIPRAVAHALDAVSAGPADSLDVVLAADHAARAVVGALAGAA
ncbi:MAG: 1-deoxy-D-xylulose-5-phosphate reductoisomerase [Thermoleophilia bacterium]|jgi:1-deoxy-D-xylulose-5-phosphate reductoisomerase|nr:1-deoxy-D-xylulose-5-phosphate reductoisomerase [Thermoleophilia bacterium]